MLFKPRLDLIVFSGNIFEINLTIFFFIELVPIILIGVPIVFKKKCKIIT